MKSLTKNLLAGLSVLLPILLSVQLIFWLVRSIESWLRDTLLLVLPESVYFPGFATLTLLLMATAIGYSNRWHLVSGFWALPGRLMDRIPLVSYLYGTIRDFVEIIRGKSFEDRAVVWVDLPGNASKVLGIVTRTGSNKESRLGGLMSDDEVAVYLPMSYQAGGYLVVLPRDRVSSVDMEPGEALKVILSAGLGSRN